MDRLRRYRLVARLIPVECYVCVGTPVAFMRWVNGHFEGQFTKPPAGQGMAFVDTPKVRQGQHFHAVIWLPYFRKGNAYDAGKLAHEALHVAWRLLEEYGTSDEELHCYLVQWLVEEATRKLIGQ